MFSVAIWRLVRSAQMHSYPGVPITQTDATSTRSLAMSPNLHGESRQTPVAGRQQLECLRAQDQTLMVAYLHSFVHDDWLYGADCAAR
jgi:hypothetical protein